MIKGASARREVGLPMRLLLRAGTMVFFRHDQMEYRHVREGGRTRGLPPAFRFGDNSEDRVFLKLSPGTWVHRLWSLLQHFPEPHTSPNTENALEVSLPLHPKPY